MIVSKDPRNQGPPRSESVDSKELESQGNPGEGTTATRHPNDPPKSQSWDLCVTPGAKDPLGHRNKTCNEQVEGTGNPGKGEGTTATRHPNDPSQVQVHGQVEAEVDAEEATGVLQCALEI